MFRPIRCAVAGLAMVSCLARAADAPGRIEQLGWLAGCWQLERSTERGVRLIDEQWMAPRGGAMLGASRTVQGAAMVEYEHVLIREDAGGLVYVAKPARQAEASFRAVELEERAVVFENPAHDFPQRIVYRLRADGALDARIEGSVRGQPRAVDFPYRRVSCPN